MIYLLHHTIQRAAQRFPEREAFRCGKKSISYAALDRQTDQLATLLMQRGVKRGDRVGVHLYRSLETPIAIFGIMKAGAAYVPLDPTAPTQRTKQLLEDCEIDHLIVHPQVLRSVKQMLSSPSRLQTVIGLAANRLDLTQNPNLHCYSWQALVDGPHQVPQVNISEHDLAYVMYTSGSTGLPKGIMHTHHSGLNYAKLSADLYALEGKDRVANHAPLHFDISTFGYFAAPLAGATTIIIPDAYTKMPASLSQLIVEEQISVWYSVPLALIQLLQRGVLEERDCHSLRWVLYAGEVFPTKHLRALMLKWSHARFSNIYGPAEVNQCTYYHLPEPPQGDDPVPLGRVWGNTEMLIMDEHDQPTPFGEIGELFIRSGTRMQGYWKQAALTQKGFYHQEIAPGLVGTFYRTGDMVYLREDGLLMFVGRKDRQVKTRGYRVELDEVEGRLVAHEEILEAAVIPIKGDNSVQIVATVILKEAQSVSEKDLQAYLAALLPWYAVPQQIQIREQFPRTSTGKINRPALQQEMAEATS
ncbi:MAG: amino acid adenylation domain-containing protein [Bacteroidota bacterium]